jgi:hypothetical protein
MTNLTYNSFFLYVYSKSLHVSSTHVPIIRRINCINTTSGIFFIIILLLHAPLHNVPLHARFVLIHICKINFKFIICFYLFGALDFTVFQNLESIQTLKIILSIFSLGHFSELANHTFLKCMLLVCPFLCPVIRSQIRAGLLSARRGCIYIPGTVSS